MKFPGVSPPKPRQGRISTFLAKEEVGRDSFMRIARHGRACPILAPRTFNLVDFGPLSRACAQADIVVSDRRLPSTCASKCSMFNRALSTPFF